MLRTTALQAALLLALGAATAEEPDEGLLAAARSGDLPAVRALLDSGVAVDLANRYGATALTMAADSGRLEVARLLLDRGANVQAKDTFYEATPIAWAARKGHVEVVRLLAERGGSRSEALTMAATSDRGEVVAALVAMGESADGALATAVSLNQPNVVKAVLDTAKIDPEKLDKALAAALASRRTKIAEHLLAAGARRPETLELPRTTLEAYAGTYRAADGGVLELSLRFRALSAAVDGQPPRELQAASETQFQAQGDAEFRVALEMDGPRAAAAVVERSGVPTRYQRELDESASTVKADFAVGAAPPANWPMFRGPDASGVADGQNPPTDWDLARGENVAWKTPIPGLGHSCPIVWGDRVFVTSAESGDPNSLFKPGAYGDVDSVDDPTTHKFWVFCLDRHSGRVLWQRLAHEGVPRFKRHTKSSHANATPATDGRYLVASFGAEGVYCYDMQGELLWKLPLDSINAGWFFQPDYEWGFGSSPVLYGDWVILQCDSQRDSFLAAYDLATGAEVWRTPREEVPTWGTPTVLRSKSPKDADEIVTNGTRAIRGYDAQTGRELWKLVGNSEITVPTPVFSDELVYVTSGYRPIQPIYAIRPGSKGDLTLGEGKTDSPHIAWSKTRGGPYMPTPLVYQGLLYVQGDGGVLSCYDAATGQRIYQKRVGGTFTASPVAADGRLYLTDEAGAITLVAAGREFAELGRQEIGETCLATPAICDGVLLVRTEHHLVALGKPRTPPASVKASAAPERKASGRPRPRLRRWGCWRCRR